MSVSLILIAIAVIIFLFFFVNVSGILAPAAPTSPPEISDEEFEGY